MKTGKNIKSTILNFETILSLDPRLINKLRRASVYFRDCTLSEVLNHINMTPGLEKLLVAAIEKILDRRKRKQPRNELAPAKKHINRFSE